MEIKLKLYPEHLEKVERWKKTLGVKKSQDAIRKMIEVAELK